MGTATNAPVDLTDLQTDLIQRIRDATGVTATNTIAARYLNIALQDMHIEPGNSFPWAIRRATLQTHATYTTGTVDIALATRTTVTGTNTLWNTAVTGMGFNNARAGGKMTFSGATDVYTVSTVGGDTSITLADRFIGDTALSGETYTYFEDEYALASDFFRPIDLRCFSSALEIPLIGQGEFHRRYPRNSTTGKPTIGALFQLEFSSSTSPQYRIVLHPAPDAVYNIPYDYVTSNLAVTSAGAAQAQLTNSTDEPIVPLRYRQAIVYHALYHWYRDRKDDARSQEAKAEYTDIMIRVSGDAKDHERPRFQPRVYSYYAQTAGRFGYRTRRGRYSTDTRFDEMRDF